MQNNKRKAIKKLQNRTDKPGTSYLCKQEGLNRESARIVVPRKQYIDAGLISFEQMDDTPITLKALLFNRFCHHTDLSLIDGAEAFKIFYVSEYTKSPINLYK